MADLLGVGTELTLDGETYAVKAPTLLEQGRYQRWLEQRARESLDRATYLDDVARATAQNAVTRDIAAGEYEWGGDLCVKALRTEAGVVKLLEVVLGVPPETARRLYDTRLGQIMAVLKAASDDDPKVLGEALKTLGLPADFLTPKRTSSSASGTRRSRKPGTKSRR